MPARLLVLAGVDVVVVGEQVVFAFGGAVFGAGVTATAVAAAAPAAPAAGAGTRSGAGHGTHEPFEHAGDLVAAVREVVEVEVELEVAAEDEVVPQPLQGGLGHVVVVCLVARAAPAEALGDVP